MFPADRLPTPLDVEYTSNGVRVRKSFPDAYAARRFYSRKSREGAEPKVLKPAQEESQVMAKKSTTAEVATSKAPKAVKTPAAKATPSANGHVGRTKKEGLRSPQARILAYLAKQKVGKGRKEISEGAPADLAMLNSYIGSHDEAIRAANDAKNFPCLLTLGYVRSQLIEGEGVTYVITAAGRKAHEKAAK